MKNKRYSFKKIEFRNPDKKPLEPLFKKQAAITAVSVLLVVLIALTGSLAVFTKTSEGNEYNVVQVGELELSYVDLNDEGNVLQLADSFPISDSDGINATPYRFSVENTGTIIANYTVKIVDDTDTIEADGCSDNLLDSTYLRYKFDNESVQDLSSKKDTTTGEYIIASGTLEPFESNIHEIRIWINENSPNSILGTHYHGKVVIEVRQNNVTDPYERPVRLVSTTAFETTGENCKTYDDGTDTFLVGQCSNNYVWYSGKLWRVVLKNNETGAVKMVTDNAITAIGYNEFKNPTFENSYMDQWLDQEFLPTLHDYEDYLVVDSVWDATEDSSSTPARPVGTTTVTRAVGLLNAYEYYTTYTNSDGLATYETGYLNNEVYWWLMTLYNSSSVRNVANDGTLNDSDPGDFAYGARPSINLKSTIQIESGTGIQSDPYILKGDIQGTTNGTTLLSTRYSGEYITFNNELYRIVDKETVNGEILTKITAVDKPSSLVDNLFDSDEVISFAEAEIKTDLEDYYQNLATTNATAYNMIQPNTIWYLGSVGDIWSTTPHYYKDSICASIDATQSMNACTNKAPSTTASIGLPRAGEMFTSQISRGTKADFWTLTPHGPTDIYVHIVWSDGSLAGDGANYYGYGARPSMYLKSGVRIARNNTGNGTYEYPYSIELGE